MAASARMAVPQFHLLGTVPFEELFRVRRRRRGENSGLFPRRNHGSKGTQDRRGRRYNREEPYSGFPH